ncbi:MAG: NAD-dependent epimerase/dehydratase family protein, partial [candidate division WOR-3 bacterium]
MAGRVRKKILVTGATGFVGSHIVDELLASDLFEVHTLIRKTSSLLYLKDKPVILHYGNILDYNSLLSSLAGIDIIIHSAGLIRARNFHQFYQYNTIGTENLLRAALATKTAQKFIYISTQAASSPSRDGRCICEEDVAHPVSQYGRSKRLAEIVLKQYKDKISVIALRPVAVYGPRDRETLKILQLLKLGFFIRPALKKTTVCLIYVKDLARVC